MSTYAELLTSEEWKTKRKSILRRDKYCCSTCSNKFLFEKTFLASTAGINKNRAGFNIFVRNYHDINNFTHLFISNKQLKYVPVSSTLLIKENNIREDVENKNRKNYSLIAIKKPTDKEINIQVAIHFAKEKGEEDNHNKLVQELYNQVKNKWDIVFGLHVHHKFYQQNLLPWEYSDEALTTLCWKCHEDLHKNETVPMYDEHGNEIGKLHYCLRCHGAGYFPEYNHVESGKCFRCSGARFEELIER